MAIHRAATWPIASRMTAGTLHFKNLYNNTFAYTETQHKPDAASDTAILAASAATVGTDQTITSGLTDPDVPRVLKVVPGGTTTDIQESVVTVTGTNVEGKVMTEEFRFAADASSAVEGVKAFRTVTSVNIDAQLSTAVTFSVGTTNKLGLNHKLFENNTTTKVYYSTTVANPTVLTLDTEPTVTQDGTQVELNTVLPDTAPNSTRFYIICYVYDNWSDGSSVNDQPEYSTTTSTSSTSSSTSTTTVTTSTSSTSVSTSSTSTSISTSSTSTSSTSTSTTTTP